MLRFTGRVSLATFMVGLMCVLLVLAAYGVQRKNERNILAANQARMRSLVRAMRKLKSPDQLGHYPPTSTSDLRGPGVEPEEVGEKVSVQNETNAGIETLFLAFHMDGIRGIKTDGFEYEDYVNTDEDQVAELIGSMPDTDLLEYADWWGNPLVYIHSDDYQGVQTYVLRDGSEVTVEAQRDPSTGEFMRKGSFQLFSMGPDQTPGTDDDIHWGDF